MSDEGFDISLEDASQNGVYFVGHEDLDNLAEVAIDHTLAACRVDLSDCHDKADLLQRIADSLRFPSTFGRNWDALADCLGDLQWLPARGYVLLFDHADQFSRTATEDFDTLLDILDDACDDGAERETPWYAFFALPDEEFDEPARTTQD